MTCEGVDHFNSEEESGSDLLGRDGGVNKLPHAPRYGCQSFCAEMHCETK